MGTTAVDQPRCVVLLSAGLDSSFNLMMAAEKFKVVAALTFDYGQRAAQREIACASRLAEKYQAPHHVIDVTWFRDFTKTALVDRKSTVPTGSEIGIDDMSKSSQSASAVWVPNRNGIFLNIAAGFAEGLGARYVIPGFNLEEAQTFPDNSGAYLKALDDSFAFSTQNRVVTHCESTHLTKTQIVREALQRKFPFKLLWPCYMDGDTWCGKCESCLRFERALEANGISFRELQARSAF
ncbi:MAG: 7-cyano-7-deazaguanine synthase QueC [Bdellovibrionales bacterium]